MQHDRDFEVQGGWRSGCSDTRRTLVPAVGPELWNEAKILFRECATARENEKRTISASWRTQSSAASSSSHSETITVMPSASSREEVEIKGIFVDVTQDTHLYDSL